MANISITKILLLFYVLIGNSLLQPLLSKQWTATVKNDRLIQHIIGFTTMLTLTILISEELEKPEEYFNIIMYTIIGYIWFIFSTKMDVHFNIIIMVSLLANYIFDNYLKMENKKILKSKVLSEQIKKVLVERNSERSEYIMFSIMFLILGGMFMYSGKKEVQYGGGYSLTNFLLY